MSEETIECRADLCGREAHLEGKDWYFCKCGWSGSSYDEVAELSAQVERLREEVMRYHRCLQNLYDKELIDDDNDHFDEVRELLEEGDEEE